MLWKSFIAAVVSYVANGGKAVVVVSDNGHVMFDIFGIVDL